MPNATFPWFRRGGGATDSSNAGIYAGGSCNGSADTLFSFRSIAIAQ